MSHNMGDYYVDFYTNKSHCCDVFSDDDNRSYQHGCTTRGTLSVCKGGHYLLHVGDLFDALYTPISYGLGD